MSQQFRTVTTNAGRNAVREALAQGKTVKLSHMSVGDGGGSPVTPTSAMTALVNERFRAQINDIALDPATPDLFTAELFIPQAEGGFYIREVGLWTEDGTLFAVGNTPLTEKPDLSSGAATDLLVRLIIRVLDAAAVAIEIDPAQVLATRDYVDRKLDAHNKDGGAHETLARKSVQIKAGTGLSGGGTLEADRTLDVKYGNAAGTACQGNDARLSDTRTPKAHKDSHKTGGADALAPGDIGAAPASHTSVAATATVLGHVKLGTTAGTACQGNDARLSNARTPTAHKATHKTGGSDALLPEEIGAARGNRISATTPATAGWYRIAQSYADISNCMGLFEITAVVSGAHSVSLIAAGISFGRALNLIQLAHAPWTNAALTKARIVYHPTYEGNFAYLEVYLSQPKATPISVNLLGGQGWTLVAPSTPGAVPSGYSVKELTLAEGKIVANVNGSLSGNAGTATKLATARTIALSGDATASGTFDGSGNLTLAATLKNSGATAGSYGPTANATPAFNATFSVPQITVDAKGRVTSAVTRTVKIPANPVATQRANGLLSAADKKALDYGEAFRLSMIGVPRFWRSTTLPAGHVWANGDLALFADWPELKKVYDAGGFNGMLLAYNANAATIAANLGKWRPNAANPTGLYVPKLGDQFFRGWTRGSDGDAGRRMVDTGRTAMGEIAPTLGGGDTGYTVLTGAEGVFYTAGSNGHSIQRLALTAEPCVIGFDLARVWGEHAGPEFAPTHIRVPVVLYLGNHA